MSTLLEECCWGQLLGVRRAELAMGLGEKLGDPAHTSEPCPTFGLGDTAPYAVAVVSVACTFDITKKTKFGLKCPLAVRMAPANTGSFDSVRMTAV
jgi:hypothetical protein